MPAPLTPQQLQDKVQSVSARHAKLLRRKAELSGELKSQKENLTSLVQEIQAAGFNPRTIVADRDKAQAELEALLVIFENNLSVAETALKEFDNK